MRVNIDSQRTIERVLFQILDKEFDINLLRSKLKKDLVFSIELIIRMTYQDLYYERIDYKELYL